MVERMEDLDLAQMRGRIAVAGSLVGRDEAVDMGVEDHCGISGNRSRNNSWTSANSLSETVR